MLQKRKIALLLHFTLVAVIISAITSTQYFIQLKNDTEKSIRQNRLVLEGDYDEYDSFDDDLEDIDFLEDLYGFSDDDLEDLYDNFDGDIDKFIKKMQQKYDKVDSNEDEQGRSFIEGNHDIYNGDKNQEEEVEGEATTTTMS